MLPPRFSIFGESNIESRRNRLKREIATPCLKLRADKEVYRPGDEVLVTVDVCSPEVPSVGLKNGASFSLLVKWLGFEVRGIEKLDSQWFTTRKSSQDSKQRRGIVPLSTIELDIYWKEIEGESEWVRVNDVYDGAEEGYDSSRDEILSVSSFNPSRENLHRAFGSSLSLLSSTARSSSKDVLFLDGERPSQCGSSSAIGIGRSSQ